MTLFLFRLLQHHDRLLARTNSSRLRFVLECAVPTYRRKGKADRGCVTFPIFILPTNLIPLSQVAHSAEKTDFLIPVFGNCLEDLQRRKSKTNAIARTRGGGNGQWLPLLVNTRLEIGPGLHGPGITFGISRIQKASCSLYLFCFFTAFAWPKYSETMSLFDNERGSFKLKMFSSIPNLILRLQP